MCCIAYVIGMFLWVKLVMDSLEGCLDRDSLEAAVDSLPEGLPQMSVHSASYIGHAIDNRVAIRRFLIKLWMD